MTNDTKSPSRVFISYAQEDAAHSARVLALANALRRDGIATELDQYHQQELIDWPRWCREQLRPDRSDWVLLICTPVYKARVEDPAGTGASVGRGVYWEGAAIVNAIYADKTNARFVPLLLDEAPDDAVPGAVEGYTRFRIRDLGLASGDPGYEGLYRLITHQPGVAAPVPGAAVELAPWAEPGTPTPTRPAGAVAASAPGQAGVAAARPAPERAPPSIAQGSSRPSRAPLMLAGAGAAVLLLGAGLGALWWLVPEGEPVPRGEPVAQSEQAPESNPVPPSNPVVQSNPTPPSNPVAQSNPVAPSNPAPDTTPVAQSKPASPLRSADTAMATGRYDEALAAYRAALALDSTDEAARYGEAKALILADPSPQLDQASAVRKLKALRKKHPGDPHLPLMLGQLAASDEDAAALYREALALDPDQPQAWFELGRLTDSPAQEQKDYERAVKLAPDDEQYLFALANLLLVRGDFSAALARYNSLLALSPDFLLARGEAGNAARLAADLVAARTHHEQLVVGLGRKDAFTDADDGEDWILDGTKGPITLKTADAKRAYALMNAALTRWLAGDQAGAKQAAGQGAALPGAALARAALDADLRQLAEVRPEFGAAVAAWRTEMPRR